MTAPRRPARRAHRVAGAVVAMGVVLVGCTPGGDSKPGRSPSVDETPAPDDGESQSLAPAPWRVPSVAKPPTTSWSLPYFEGVPTASPDDVTVLYAELAGDDPLVAFTVMGDGTSTASDEDLLITVFNAATGQVAWQTDVTASLGLTGTWASVTHLGPIGPGNDVGAVVQMDQSTWLVRLSGVDGAVLTRQEFPGLRTEYAAAVVGTVVVMISEDDRSIVAYDLTDPAQPLWVQDASVGAHFCAVTVGVVYVGPDYCDAITGQGGLLLDARTGEPAAAAAALVGAGVSVSATGDR